MAANNQICIKNKYIILKSIENNKIVDFNSYKGEWKFIYASFIKKPRVLFSDSKQIQAP